LKYKKNKKYIDPRYFLDEKTIQNESFAPLVGAAARAAPAVGAAAAGFVGGLLGVGEDEEDAEFEKQKSELEGNESGAAASQLMTLLIDNLIDLSAAIMKTSDAASIDEIDDIDYLSTGSLKRDIRVAVGSLNELQIAIINKIALDLYNAVKDAS
jgi:hypothetical protein